MRGASTAIGCKSNCACQLPDENTRGKETLSGRHVHEALENCGLYLLRVLQAALSTGIDAEASSALQGHEPMPFPIHLDQDTQSKALSKTFSPMHDRCKVLASMPAQAKRCSLTLQRFFDPHRHGNSSLHQGGGAQAVRFDASEFVCGPISRCFLHELTSAHQNHSSNSQCQGKAMQHTFISAHKKHTTAVSVPNLLHS